MSRFVRKAAVYTWHTGVVLSLLAVFLGLYWTVAYSISVNRRHHAEQLLQKLAAEELGGKDAGSIQKIARDFGARESCFPEICTYELSNSFAFSGVWPMRILGGTAWDYFGLRPWEVTISVGRSGAKPSLLQVVVAVGWNRGWGMWSWRVVGMDVMTRAAFDHLVLDEERYPMSEAERQTRLAQDRDYGMIIVRPSLDTPGGGEALTVYFSSDASATSKRAAFDRDLDCATSIKPCSEIFQLAPSLRQFYARTFKNQ